MIALTKFYKGKIDMEKTEIGFDKTNTFPIMVKNMFRPSADGQLEHWMDDKLRATVPPESWDAYCKEWPAAREVCDSLLLPRGPSLDESIKSMIAISHDLPDDSGIIVQLPDTPQEVNDNSPSGEENQNSSPQNNE
jgi:hypothetical protein